MAYKVRSSLSLTHAPLDIFLLRSHALPLLYLTFPAISFLVYLSPPAYLSVLRLPSSPSRPRDGERLPQMDIAVSTLRPWLTTHPIGVTLATLCLATLSDAQLFPVPLSMPSLTTRPTFSLSPQGSELEHIFPQTSDLPGTSDGTDSITGQHIWVLDFTDGGKRPGIVMSQSRMRDIELVVNPLSGMDNLSSVGMLSFTTGSWVDLIVRISLYSS
jgi:hypothetical protein